MEDQNMESSAIYLISDARMELVDLWVEGNPEPFNYIELQLDYSYVDESGETMIAPVAPLCMDMDALIEMSAMCARAMVRLEDANPVQLVGWEQDLEFDEDDFGDYDPNSGPELD